MIAKTVKTLIVLAGILVAMFAFAASASAQTVPPVVPSQVQLAFDAAPDWAVVGVSGFRLQVDAGPLQDLGVVTPDAQGVYKVAFPATQPGVRTISVLAYNEAGDGLPAGITVRVVIAPGKPGNLRIASAEVLVDGQWRVIL